MSGREADPEGSRGPGLPPPAATASEGAPADAFGASSCADAAGNDGSSRVALILREPGAFRQAGSCLPTQRRTVWPASGSSDSVVPGGHRATRLPATNSRDGRRLRTARRKPSGAGCIQDADRARDHLKGKRQEPACRTPSSSCRCSSGRLGRCRSPPVLAHFSAAMSVRSGIRQSDRSSRDASRLSSAVSHSGRAPAKPSLTFLCGKRVSNLPSTPSSARPRDWLPGTGSTSSGRRCSSAVSFGGRLVSCRGRFRPGRGAPVPRAAGRIRR